MLLWLLAVLAWPAVRAWAQPAIRKSLPGHVPSVIKELKPVGVPPAEKRLRLAISLTLRNRADLADQMQRLYDPSSPEYHQYLTPEQFTARYGPSEEDYQAVLQFAQTNGLELASTHSSRMLLDVSGRITDVEKAFQVTLRTYQHPTEARTFYAPDVEPSVDAGLPATGIAGLSDWVRLGTALHRKQERTNVAAVGGSGPGRNYLGSDFRHAYAPGVALNGSGQSVGLFEADGYYASDISAYETLAGLPNVPLINVLTDGFSGSPGTNNDEVALDIEMAISMAPGLARVVVFEGPNDVADWLDILDSMSSSNQIKQFSSSWGYTGPPNTNSSFDAVFMKMAMQGQSFFQASGDGDAWVNPIWIPGASPYLMSVGGTHLTMNGSGASYASDMVWNSGNLGSANPWFGNGDGYWGSGGGISTSYAIPSWQQAVSTAANGGSTSLRNIPDVALTSDDIWVTFGNGSEASFIGTSCAAPLWAGFIALVNQQSAANGKPTVGFINPAIYAIGRGANYTNCFHDVTVGNDTSSLSPTEFFAVPGYDLCTGWGTPAGQPLIDALAPDGLGIIPVTGISASGNVGGPFTNSSVTLTLTNRSGSSLSWVCGNATPWLSIAPTNGTLAPGQTASAVVSLNSAARTLVAGVYSAEISFTNLGDGVVQGRQNLLLASPPAALGTYADTVLSYHPVAYWQLNETNVPPPADIVSNVGSLGFVGTGFAFNNVAQGQPGIVSNCVAFSNPGLVVTYLGSYIDVPYNPLLNPSGPFTVEYWAKPNQTPTDFFCPVSSIDDSENGNAARFGWVFYEATGNQWVFRLGNSSGYVAVLAGGTVETNVWQHVAGVYDGTNASLYVNGALAAGPTSAAGFSPNANLAVTLRIGATSFGNRTFDGAVDEVAVYTNALSGNTIAAHYHAATTNNAGYGAQILASQPVGYWHLDEPAYVAPAPGTLPTAFNIGSLSYLAEGTYQPGAVPGVAGVPGSGFGVSNRACEFVATSYIDVPGAWLSFTGALTVSAWAKAPAAAGQVRSVVSMGAGSYQLTMDGQGHPHFADGALPLGDLIGTNRIDDNQWHHLAGVYDGVSAEYLYVDGQLVARATNAAVAPVVTGNDLWIGGDSDPGMWQLFDGVVDEVAMFTNALSADQILWLFSTGSNATQLSAAVNSHSPHTITLTWAAIAGQAYQVEYKTNLSQTNWIGLGGTIMATNSTASVLDSVGSAPEKFYRVVLVP
jgi:Concanavalin A-like lectin/glucanases superfamily/Pro-kumamolisin, activation domain